MAESEIPEIESPVVRTGMHVVLDLVDESGGSERLELDIVPDALADFPQGFLGEGTPLARAISGQRTGAAVNYQQADITQVRILAVTPSAVAPDAETAREREESIRKAVAEVERRNAILFASSFSGKWGDYDPSGMEHWEGDQVTKPDETRNASEDVGDQTP